MKYLLTLLFLIPACFAGAQISIKYTKAKVIFADGTSRSGLAETRAGGGFLYFKPSEDAEPEKLEETGLKTIIYNFGDKDIEFDRIKVYLGWKQKRISNFGWFQVVERGTATLYVKATTMQTSMYDVLSTAGFQDYYVMRPGEPAAKLIANISGANNNQTFRAKAPLYFQDYPELADKIKSKEYTWKDLVPAVQEYNAWTAGS